MNKKYFLSLLALTLLASCSSEVTNTEVTTTQEIKTQAALQEERDTLRNIDEVSMEIEESEIPLVTEVPIEEVMQETQEVSDDSQVVVLKETYTSPG